MYTSINWKMDDKMHLKWKYRATKPQTTIVDFIYLLLKFQSSEFKMSIVYQMKPNFCVLHQYET